MTRRFIPQLLLPLLLNLVFSTQVQGEEPLAVVPWETSIYSLKPLHGEMAPLLPDGADLALAQESQQLLYSAIAHGYIGLFSGDAQHPDFWPMANLTFPYGAANPDNSYYTAPLDGKGVFKISGFRGTVLNVDFQIGGGHLYTRGEMPLAQTYANYDIDSLEIGENGYFEVILSQERPEGYRGNWWQLHPDATYVWVRQTSYDWVNEVDGRFAIDRLDTPAAKPRPGQQQIGANLAQITTWARNWAQLGPRWLGRLRAEGYVNKMKVHDLASVGGFTSKQMYLEGIFQLEADEALIYETDVPKDCRYWNIQLTDMLWRSLDWMNRQTSINGHTANISGDGKFRAVISATDPGVPNWLDTLDYREGEVIGRWKECGSYPTPVLTKVKLADVRKHLPADTPVITPQQREADIRLRRQGAQLRRRW